MGMTKGHITASVIIGSLQLVLAAGVIISSFVFSSYGHLPASVTPYWLGFGYILPGVFGIAALSKNQCCMVTFLVLNIIVTIVSAVAAIILTVAWSFWSVAIDEYQSSSCQTVNDQCICNNYKTYTVDKCEYLDTITGVLIAVTLFCYCSSALALAGSIVGCMATCCAPPDHQPAVIVTQQPYPAGVVISNTSTMAAGPGAYPPGSYPPGAYNYPAPATYAQGPAPQYTGPTHDKAPLVL